MREVAQKQKRWAAENARREAEFLGRHVLPVVLGPKAEHYVIDHHHLARALHEDGMQDVLVTVVANLKNLDMDAFWVVLDNKSWMHPFDDHGRRREYADIPKTVRQLVDDPFRSLAGALRRADGFAKDTTLFSEFLPIRRRRPIAAAMPATPTTTLLMRTNCGTVLLSSAKATAFWRRRARSRINAYAPIQ